MFTHFLEVLHNIRYNAAERERDDYLAASADLADLEHRMEAIDHDTRDAWLAGSDRH